MTNCNKPNKLVHEKSPYLLQHAYNPVNWYPWGEEAFNKAKDEDKPVFLSVGYSTCHWCHVMERESFEDEQVASILNESFVSIKVDREERPDVDTFYMDACVSLNGSGGWPLSCFLTHDRKPFYAGTYFPKNDSVYGAGFLTILRRIEEVWKNSRSDMIGYADTVTRHLDWRGEYGFLNQDHIHAAFRQLKNSYDKIYGGFGGAPKFPSPHNLMFLMRYGLEYHNQSALEMVRHSLDCMYLGGIYDHIGGGFARYSTDRQWLIPHFEKMMTDNALHIMVYSEAAELFGGDYARIVQEITRFCIREMMNENGGFYTAIDADSEGEEGKYYAFTPDEVEQVFGGEDGQRYCRLYHITRRGNFGGKNIPNLIENGLPENEISFVRSCNEKMLLYRSKRVPPFHDDKIHVLVNGLMIAALAVEGRILHDGKAVETAQKCASFLLSSLYQNGRLFSRWRGGEAGIPASSDDYACLIWGLIELYQATLNPKWLIRAVQLTGEMDALFLDNREGGYYLAGSDAYELPLRQKNLLDSALPSGNSIMALNLLRLARLTATTDYEERANQIFRLAAPISSGQPRSCTFLLCSLMYLKNGGTEIVLANGDGFELLKRGLPAFLPFATVAACGKGFEEISAIAPHLRNYRSVAGNAAAYVCRKGSCMEPTTLPDQLNSLLQPGRLN